MESELRSNQAGLLRAACGKAVAMTVRSGAGGQAELYLPKDARSIRVFLTDGWLIQRLNGKLYVQVTPAAGEDLQLTMDEPVTLTPDGGVPAIRNVTGLVCRRDGQGARVTVTSADAEAPGGTGNPEPGPGRQPPVNPEPGTAIAGESTPADDPMAEETLRLRRQLSDARKQAAEALRDKQILEQQLREEMTAAARQVLAQRQDYESETVRAAENLTAEEDSLQAARAALERVKDGLEGTIRDTAQVRAVIGEMQEQAKAKLAGRRELTELDEEAVRDELEQARERLLEDRELTELLTADPVSGAESIRDALRRADEALENAEKRLRQIVQLRERICQSVRQAIDAGDGRVTTKAETGEDQ